MSLKESYAEALGEGGTKLSGGERQRLMIMRALFAKPEVLFFDEATSALDYENKLLVYDLIREDFPNLTLIAISHDENEIRFFDREIKIAEILSKVS